MPPIVRAALIAAASLGGVALSAGAQVLPSEPIALAGGRVTFSGDASASVAPADTGFFNYTDYDHSALRVLTLDLTTSITPNPHLAMLGEIRDEVGLLGQPSDDSRNTLRVYALYVRIRPWIDRPVDIQAGRVPPTFGAFARRIYANDNFLIGYPLAYQYLTSLRPDALPWNADELLKMRGRGWLSSFSIGNQTPEAGVPLVTAFRWDTGVQLHVGSDALDGTVAVTAGTLSNPRTIDDNSAPQVVGRVSAHPIPGLILGVSASRGPFVSSAAARGAVGDGHENSFTQTAVGGDIEYSRDYYVVRAETVWSAWKLPVLGAPLIDSPLSALATYVEGRYKIQPRLYVAGRVDHLGFSEVVGSAGPQTWDAPVTRVEAGGGYSIQRNLLLKVSIQHNARDGGRVTNATYAAAQLVYWF